MELSGRIRAIDVSAGDSLTRSARPAPTLRVASQLWIAAGTLAILLFGVVEGSVASIAAYVVFGLVGYAWSRRTGLLGSRVYLCVFGAAAAFAVILYAYMTAKFGIPYWQGVSDEVSFERDAAAFATQFGVFDYASLRGNIVVVTHNSVAYVYLVGLLFKFARLFDGDTTMVPRLFNAACLGLVAAAVCHLATLVRLRPRTAVIVGLCAGGMPLMVWTAVQTLREAVIAALLVGLVVAWTPDRDMGHRRGTLTAIVWSVLVVVCLADLRLAHALVAILITAVGLFIATSGRHRHTWLLWFGLLTALFVAGYATVASIVSINVAKFLEQSSLYSLYRVESVGGGLSTVVFTTPPPLGWVLRVAYAMVSPLPILSSDLDVVWLSIGTIVQILFIPFFLRGLAAFRLEREWTTIYVAFGLLFAGMAFFSFSWRHIVQYYPFALLITGSGYERLAGRRAAVFGVMVLVGALLASTYLVLKL